MAVAFLYSGIIMGLLSRYIFSAYSYGIDFYVLKFNEFGEMRLEALLFPVFSGILIFFGCKCLTYYDCYECSCSKIIF